MRTLIYCSALLVICACSSKTPSDDDNGGSGGKSGQTGTGGSTSGGSAGAHATGGTGATGGTTATGGTGGTTATGGTGATGGANTTGGAAGKSGGASVGGSSATGGATGTGGTGVTAGAPGSGGMTGSAGSGTSGAAAGGSGGAGATHWVGTWTASPYLADSTAQPAMALSNSVLRQVTHVSIAGSQIRVQFSNLSGNGSVMIKAAHVALCKATSVVDSTIDTTTDTALAFSGMPSVTIMQGAEVWSDPVNFSVPSLGNVTITTSLGTVPGNLTAHAGSRTTSYQAASSTDLAVANMSSAMTTPHWYFISGIDVMADASASAVVAIGDSITDGRGTDRDHNNRWTDVLSSRLQGNPPTANVGMLNQGIGATNLIGTTGTAAEARFARDVLGPSGVKYAIILDGVNDIGGGSATMASQLEDAYDQMCDAAHQKNVLVYGGTITPFGGNTGSGGYASTAHEALRVAVNNYIKGADGTRKSKFDGFIDFATAVADPSNPSMLDATYSMWTAGNPDGSADGLHPGPAGYAKMGQAADLTLFTK